MKKNKVNLKKLVFIISVVVIIAILIFIFIKMYYKNKNLGHNMSNKNLEEIEEYILNISSYKAKVEVTVESNKNTNQYFIQQEYQKDTFAKQTVLEPSNIEGIEMQYEAGKLTIRNSKLNLTTVYENYDYLVGNCLWLDSFIKDYEQGKSNQSATISEENDMVKMETKTRDENNRYMYHKTLIIDKKTGKITKLSIADINKKNLIYILYNEITVNDVK